jgi:hypothetical protein
MAFEYVKASEEQKSRAAEIGLALVGLGRKKAAIQTERATAEVGWNLKLNAIQAEEHKLADELATISDLIISEK